MMNNLQTRALCVLGASALLMGAGAVLDLQAKPAAAASIPVVSDEASLPAPAWMVGAQNGVVAVFTGDGQLVRLTDSPVSALPAADRESLLRGIPVEDDVQLAMLLEDYELSPSTGKSPAEAGLFSFVNRLKWVYSVRTTTTRPSSAAGSRAKRLPSVSSQRAKPALPRLASICSWTAASLRTVMTSVKPGAVSPA